MPIRSAIPAAAAAGNPDFADQQWPLASARWHAARPIDGDAVFRVPALARVLVLDAGPGIAIGDWDDLLNSVKDRLTRTVTENQSGLAESSDSGAAQIRDAVLECVAALDQLQETVTAERMRHEGLELAFFEAQTALSQVRAALIGTQQAERVARHAAAHDSLTQLPNRGFLLERITEELVRPDSCESMFAVMFLDLNGFKLVNDNHGQAAGDELLRIVAARLRRVVRAQDVVSRVAGDAFACLISGVQDRAQLAHLADKMVQALAAPCSIGRLQLAVHASIGIAICPVDGFSADALLNSAELAMGAAKRQRAGHAFFSRDDAGATAVRQHPEPRSPPLPRS